MTDQRTARYMAMLHAHAHTLKKGDPISPPIVTSAKYLLPGTPDVAHTYGRDENPTIEILEAALGALEDASCLVYPSGMAAITAAVMSVCEAGQRILVPSDGYYGTRVLLSEALNGLKLQIDTLPTRDFNTADLSQYQTVWAETPSNPGLDLCDINALAARLRGTQTRLVVDNTTLTPLLQRPLDLGADLTICSDTKAMSGHSDALMGHISTRDETLLKTARTWRKQSGSICSGFEAFLVHRGLMTLDVRLERMCRTAQTLNKTLLPMIGRTKLKTLRYPGIGFILGLSFEDQAIADHFIETCPAIFPSTSFGGVHTSAERRARWGDAVPEGFVRLSVGCEPEHALIAAITDTLHAL